MTKNASWLLSLALAVPACESSGSNDEESDETSSMDSDDGGEAEATTPEMRQRSLLSTGNNVRTKAVLAKAAAGEPVTIAYIGGSITEGYTRTADDSYVVHSYEAFKANFASGDGSHVNFVNAGMGGTPSTLGMIRYERDVLQRAATPPDLVFVEFAVNDGDDPTLGAAYESLVRRILLSDNAPAVVLIFSVFKSRWNLEDRLTPVGRHYDLPMISIKQAVLPELSAGALTDDEFWRDEYHPTPFGFRIMSETITHFFSTVAAEEADPSDIVVPEPLIGGQFTDVRMIAPSTPAVPGELEIEVGSFGEYDNVNRTYEWSFSEKIFPENWHKKSGTPNEPFVANVTCKNLSLVYKKSSSAAFGDAQVFLDGELLEVQLEPQGTPVDTIPGYTSDAWNNPWTVVLLDEQESAEHTLEIRMTEETAEEAFTIFALGYTP